MKNRIKKGDIVKVVKYISLSGQTLHGKVSQVLYIMKVEKCDSFKRCNVKNDKCYNLCDKFYMQLKDDNSRQYCSNILTKTTEREEFLYRLYGVFDYEEGDR